MKALRKHAPADLLKQLVPLNQLDDSARARLARAARMEMRESGDVLFRKGDQTKVTVYLLDGEVGLSSPLSPDERIRAGSDAARYPLAHHFPRHVTACALHRTKLLVIEGDIAELIAGAADKNTEEWKTAWLDSPLFKRLSQSRLEELLGRMQEITVEAGQVVIHQDEAADCYYVIKQGRCSVSRRPAPRARDVKLAELVSGQGFGEEALITNATRNASITMMEDGVLLRLGKEDFIDLLAQPLLRHLPFDELMSHGNAVLVDVRTQEEFETDGIIGSLNMPMPVLRLKAHRLDPRRTYVVYSNTGHFSTAAAFILLQHGLDAYVLKDGLSGAPRHRIKHGAHERPIGSQAASQRAIVDFPAAKREPTVNFDWVSDEAMWRNTIGLRNDQELDALFAPSDMYRKQAFDNSHQGFEDVRLFTKVGSGTGQRLSLAGDETAHSSSFMRGADGAHQRNEDGAGAMQETHRSRTGSGFYYNEPASKRISKTSIVAVALVMLAVGFAAAYWTNDDLRVEISNMGGWLQEQRDLDAKVSRLLDNIEKLPALQTLQREQHNVAAPVVIDRNSTNANKAQ